MLVGFVRGFHLYTSFCSSSQYFSVNNGSNDNEVEYDLRQIHRGILHNQVSLSAIVTELIYSCLLSFLCVPVTPLC